MTSSMTRPDRARAVSRSRRVGRLWPMALVSILVLLAGWSALWLAGRHEAQRNFTDWVRREARQGRVWTCPNRRVGGFPLAIVLSCDHPTFRGPLGAGVYAGTLDRFTAEAALYNPTSIAIALAAPLDLSDADGSTRFHLGWTGAAVALRGDIPGDFDRAEIRADDVSMTVAGTAPFALQLGHVALSLRQVGQGTAAPPDLDLGIEASGIESREADAAFGSSDFASLSARALLTRFDPKGTSLRQVLEPWRAAGGQMLLRTITVGKGAFRGSGDGRFSIDDEHRLDGRIEARFTGLEPVAARWGIPIGAVKLGGALANLFGGKTAPAATATDLALPIVARDGSLLIGPVKTGLALPPLY